MLPPGDDESSKDKNEAQIKPPSYKEFGTTNRHTEKQTESYMELQLKKENYEKCSAFPEMDRNKIENMWYEKGVDKSNQDLKFFLFKKK